MTLQFGRQEQFDIRKRGTRPPCPTGKRPGERSSSNRPGKKCPQPIPFLASDPGQTLTSCSLAPPLAGSKLARCGLTNHSPTGSRANRRSRSAANITGGLAFIHLGQCPLILLGELDRVETFHSSFEGRVDVSDCDKS